jgi:hypothetical protein
MGQSVTQKDIPGQRKIPLTQAYHLLILGYPIPGFFNLGYARDIQQTSKISLGYPAPGHIPGLS